MTMMKSMDDVRAYLLDEIEDTRRGVTRGERLGQYFVAYSDAELLEHYDYIVKIADAFDDVEQFVDALETIQSKRREDANDYARQAHNIKEEGGNNLKSYYEAKYKAQQMHDLVCCIGFTVGDIKRGG